jgi:hypothetical protein
MVIVDKLIQKLQVHDWPTRKVSCTVLLYSLLGRLRLLECLQSYYDPYLPLSDKMAFDVVFTLMIL